MKKNLCERERERKRESGGTGEGLGERSFTLKYLRKMNIKCHQYVDPAVKLIKYYSPGWTKTKTEISWGVLFLFKRKKKKISCHNLRQHSFLAAIPVNPAFYSLFSYFLSTCKNRGVNQLSNNWFTECLWLPALYESLVQWKLLLIIKIRRSGSIWTFFWANKELLNDILIEFRSIYCGSFNWSNMQMFICDS